MLKRKRKETNIVKIKNQNIEGKQYKSKLCSNVGKYLRRFCECKGVKPHVHIDGRHDSNSNWRKLNDHEIDLVNKIRRKYGVN